MVGRQPRIGIEWAFEREVVGVTVAVWFFGRYRLIHKSLRCDICRRWSLGCCDHWFCGECDQCLRRG